jgi:trimeric autotransporter adhesin
MGIGSIGSSTSFWQQDQSYWSNQQAASASTAAQASLINVMGNAMVTEARGLASIANGQALKRVNSQLVAAVQSLLSGNSTSTGSSSSSTSSGSSTSSARPATATGTALVTTSTSLSTLGIPAGGTITISAGANTTTYASTGSDTVGSLMNAVNTDLVGNAAVTASLSNRGNLVLTSKNTTDTITIRGIYASNLGFGVGNTTFKPTAGTASTSSAPTTSSSSATTSPKSTAKATTKQSFTTVASETASSAASILSASGASGSLVNMLA